MQPIDSLNNIALTVDDIIQMDTGRVSNTENFEKFSKGINLREDFLLNDRWNTSALEAGASIFDFVMHEMLPSVYDVSWLDKIGGHFGIRITGVGDYTALSVNHRVVTLAGASVDFETYEEVIDVEIAPEVLSGFFRGLLLDVADSVLDDEDEHEDRVVSDAELVLHGMPSGGNAMTSGPISALPLYVRAPFNPIEGAVGSFGADLAAANRGEVGTVNFEGTATGTFDEGYDRDWIAVTLTAGETYTIDFQGSWMGLGHTVSLPMMTGIYASNGSRVGNGLYSSHDGGAGNDQKFSSATEFTATETGVYFIETRGYGNGGSYELKVNPKHSSWNPETGFVGTVVETHLSPTVQYSEFAPVQEVGGNWDSSLNQAIGLPDSYGTVDFNGNAAGAVNEWGDRDWIAVNLRAGERYDLYLQGRSTGGGTLDHPSIYGIYDSNGELVTHGPRGNSFWVNSDDYMSFTATEAGVYYVEVGAAVLSSAPGVNTVGTYQLAVRPSGDAQWQWSTQTSSWQHVSGTRGTWDAEHGYVGTVIDTRALSNNEALSNTDFGAGLEQSFVGNVGTIGLERNATGRVDHAGDQDWYAVALRAGDEYTFELRGSGSGYDKGGTLHDPKIHGVYDSTGALVHSGNDDGGDGLESRMTFTAEESGIFYISAGAYGNHVGSYSLYVSGGDWVLSPGTPNPVLPTPPDPNSVTGYAIDSDAPPEVAASIVNTGGEAPCGGKGVVHSICGQASSTNTTTHNNWAAAACHKDASHIGINVNAGVSVFACGGAGYAAALNLRYVNAFACGSAFAAALVNACGGNAGACGGNAFACGGNACGVAASVCGALASAYAISGCGANAGAIGAGALAGGVFGCGANTFNCGIVADATFIYGCGAKAGVAAIGINIGGISGCGAKSSACAVDTNLTCSALAVGCVLNLGWGLDVGVCAINILPILPSC